MSSKVLQYADYYEWRTQAQIVQFVRGLLSRLIIQHEDDSVGNMANFEHNQLD